MQRILALAVALILPGTLVAQDANDKYRPMIDKGMAWLVKQQAKEGHWASSTSFPAATTAFAGMALLADGNTPSQGKHKVPLRMAMTWFLKQKPNDKKYHGLLGDIDDPRSSGRYMVEHGVALSFLSKLYGEVEDKDERIALRDRLRDAVAFSVKGQSSQGGWFYTSTMKGHDSSENVATMLQLQGLLDARDVGIAVPRETLTKARALLKNCTTEQGGISYSGRADGKPPAGGGRPTINAMALAALMARHEPLDEVSKRWLAFCAEQPALTPVSKKHFDLLPAYYFTKVVFHLDERQWRAALGDKKRPEHLEWRKYRTALFDHLQSEQSKDGSWSGKGWSNGPVFNTVLALNILLYEDSVPPALSR